VTRGGALPAPLVRLSAAAQDRSGFYAGAVLGHGSGESNHINGAADTNAPRFAGAAFGVTLGYNASAGHLVYGVEADAAILGMEGMTGPGSVGGFSCADGCRTEVNWRATLRGRVGVVQGRTLFFGTAGLAVGGVRGSLSGEAYADLDTRTATGWTLGAGVEHRISDKVSIKAEVLHTDLGLTRYDDRSFEPGFYVDTPFTQVRLGMNVRF
jgi:outer membrane immunogenic protein